MRGRRDAPLGECGWGGVRSLRVSLAEAEFARTPITFHSFFHCQLFLGMVRRDLMFSPGDTEKPIRIIP